MVRHVGEVDHTRELDIAIGKTLLAIPQSKLITGTTVWHVEIVEVNATLLSARRETHIVREPIDGHDATTVARELHPLAQLHRVEVVNVN